MEPIVRSNLAEGQSSAHAVVQGRAALQPN